MEKYTVITTCHDGELRYYEVYGGNTCEALVNAFRQDKNDYPDKMSSFKASVILSGHNLAMLHINL